MSQKQPKCHESNLDRLPLLSAEHLILEEIECEGSLHVSGQTHEMPSVPELETYQQVIEFSDESEESSDSSHELTEQDLRDIYVKFKQAYRGFHSDYGYDRYWCVLVSDWNGQSDVNPIMIRDKDVAETFCTNMRRSNRQILLVKLGSLNVRYIV